MAEVHHLSPKTNPTPSTPDIIIKCRKIPAVYKPAKILFKASSPMPKFQPAPTADGKAIESSTPKYPTNEGILHCGNITCPFAAPAHIKVRNILLQLRTSINKAIKIKPSLRNKRWYNTYYNVWIGEGLLENFNNPKNLELITCWPRPSHPNPTYEGILKNIERIIPSKYLHPPANFHYDAPIIKISAAAASKITSPVAHHLPPADCCTPPSSPSPTPYRFDTNVTATVSPSSPNDAKVETTATAPAPTTTVSPHRFGTITAPPASAPPPSNYDAKAAPTAKATPYEIIMAPQARNHRSTPAARPMSPPSILPSLLSPHAFAARRTPPKPSKPSKPQLSPHAFAARCTPPQPSKLQLKPHAFAARCSSPPSTTPSKSPLPHHTFAARRTLPLSPSTLKAQPVECQLPSVVNRPSPTIHHSPPKNDEDVTFEDDDPAVHCRPTVSAPTTTATHIKLTATPTGTPTAKAALSVKTFFPHKNAKTAPPATASSPPFLPQQNSSPLLLSPTTTATNSCIFNYLADNDDDDYDIHPSNHHILKPLSSNINPSPSIKTICAPSIKTICAPSSAPSIHFTTNFTFPPATNESIVFDKDNPSSTHPPSNKTSNFDDNENAVFDTNDPSIDASDNMGENTNTVYHDEDSHSLSSDNPYDYIQEPDEYDEWEYYHG